MQQTEGVEFASEHFFAEGQLMGRLLSEWAEILVAAVLVQKVGHFYFNRRRGFLVFASSNLCRGRNC